MSKPESHYWGEEIKRTLNEMKDLCGKKKDHFGCISKPLLDIPLENVRIDELHLLLRITGRLVCGMYLDKSHKTLLASYSYLYFPYHLDVLERNLILNTIKWDLQDDKNKKPKEPKGKHLNDLVKAINECGIPFTVWSKLDGNGKKTNNYDWRSLVGKEKKHLLHNLPERFNEVLHPETSETIKHIWQVYFKNLYLYNSNLVRAF